MELLYISTSSDSVILNLNEILYIKEEYSGTSKIVYKNGEILTLSMKTSLLAKKISESDL